VQSLIDLRVQVVSTLGTEINTTQFLEMNNSLNKVIASYLLLLPNLVLQKLKVSQKFFQKDIKIDQVMKMNIEEFFSMDLEKENQTA
jgi:hypothetical protein